MSQSFLPAGVVEGLLSEADPLPKTNGTHTEIQDIPVARLRRQLPPGLRVRLKEPPMEGQRSDQVYRFACELKEKGVVDTIALAALAAFPPTTDKYAGSALHREVQRVWAKAKSNGGTAKAKKRKAKKREEPEDELIIADSFEMAPVEWLMDQWIPRGEMSVLAGRQGNGKSQWTCWLAAQVSRGKLGNAPQDVLFASLEDSTSKTIVPRLIAAGANMKRVHIVAGVRREEGKDVLRLPQDAGLIASKASRVGASLVVIDPMSAALASGAQYDSHNESDVRRALAPLHHYAEESNAALLMVMHLKKAVENDLMMGVGGSVALTAAPRSVMVLGYDNEDGANDRDRVLVHVKSNLSALQEPRVYRMNSKWVAQDVSSSYLRAMGHARIDAHELSMDATKGPSKLQAAVLLLQDELSGGATAYRDLLEKAEAKGISDRTLKRAKKRLGVKTSIAGGKGGTSKWSLS